MGRFAAERHSALITGVPVREEVHHQRRYYNGITVTGEGDGTYLKQKLVPFGEYVPLQDVLRGAIEFFNLPMSDFARGPEDQPLLQAKATRLRLTSATRWSTPSSPPAWLRVATCC